MESIPFPRLTYSVPSTFTPPQFINFSFQMEQRSSRGVGQLYDWAWRFHKVPETQNANLYDNVTLLIFYFSCPVSIWQEIRLLWVWHASHTHLTLIWITEKKNRLRFDSRAVFCFSHGNTEISHYKFHFISSVLKSKRWYFLYLTRLGKDVM